MGKYVPAHHPLVLQPCDCFDFSSSPLLQNKDPGAGLDPYLGDGDW